MIVVKNEEILYEITEICQTIPKSKTSVPLKTKIVSRILATDAMEAQCKNNALMSRHCLEKKSDDVYSYVKVLNKRLPKNQQFIEDHKDDIRDGVVVSLTRI